MAYRQRSFASRIIGHWSFLLALIPYFCLFASPVPASAASKTLRTASGSRILINARSLDSDLDRRITVLTGEVQILYDQQYLKCDRATINEVTQEIEAEGNLVISSPQTYIEGDKAIMSYRDNTGVIINGFVKSGQVIFEGRVVRKTGENSYEAENAYYTACTTCPPAWGFAGTRIEAEMGGYAYIKNSILEVGNVPVFWLPYLIVPLKSERQTGLLIPSLEFGGNDDIAVTLRYFWAISRSQDATFALKNYSKRGLKGLFNYRYMLSESSYGELDAGMIKDRIYSQDQTLRNLNIDPNENRWYLTYNHQYDLPNGFSNKAKINLVSDLKYPRDFTDEMPGQGDPALENRVSLTRNTESTHSSLDAAYYINQLREDPTAGNRDAVHRWPELRFATTETNLYDTGLLFNFNFNYVNFAREDFAYDDVLAPDNGPRTIDPTRSANQGGQTPSAGGRFDPGVDLIRAGQRFNIEPEISYPIRIGSLFDILPSAQFRHTQYSFNVTVPPGEDFDPTPFRQYVRGRISIRTRFYRIYGRNEGISESSSETSNQTAAQTDWIDAESRGQDRDLKPPSLVRPSLLRHEVEPELIFAGVPYLNDTNNPFFGETAQVPSFLDNQPVSDADFQSRSGIQFDYLDRIINRNTLSFVLNNRFVQKAWSGDTPVYRQIANLRLSQSYDFDEAQRNNGAIFPWSDVSALLDVRLDNFDTNTLVRYFPYHNVTNTSSRARLRNDRGDFIELSFNQTFLITQRIDDAYENREENIGLGAGFESKYFGFAGAIATMPEQFDPIRLKVKSWSTLMTIRPPGDCWGIRLGFRQDIGSPDRKFKIDFDYKFGGETGT